MGWQIEPPLERRHKVGLAIMAFAAIAAVLLIDAWVDAQERRSAQEWIQQEHLRETRR